VKRPRRSRRGEMMGCAPLLGFTEPRAWHEIGLDEFARRDRRRAKRFN
jgi:hypothetical protein